MSWSDQEGGLQPCPTGHHWPRLPVHTARAPRCPAGRDPSKGRRARGREARGATPARGSEKGWARGGAGTGTGTGRRPGGSPRRQDAAGPQSPAGSRGSERGAPARPRGRHVTAGRGPRPLKFGASGAGGGGSRSQLQPRCAEVRAEPSRAEGAVGFPLIAAPRGRAPGPAAPPPSLAAAPGAKSSGSSVPGGSSRRPGSGPALVRGQEAGGQVPPRCPSALRAGPGRGGGGGRGRLGAGEVTRAAAPAARSLCPPGPRCSPAPDLESF